MDKKTERRSMKRQRCNCEANWAYFNKDGYLKGHILNCSQGGTYIETAKPITPGATVLVRVLQCEDFMADRHIDIRLNAIAQVKWCRDMKEKNRSRYAIGLKYH